jgi:hypothetical protein
VLGIGIIIRPVAAGYPVKETVVLFNPFNHGIQGHGVGCQCSDPVTLSSTFLGVRAVVTGGHTKLRPVASNVK